MIDCRLREPDSKDRGRQDAESLNLEPVFFSQQYKYAFTQLLKTGPLWHVLTVLLALLMFREVCQMSASLKRYLLSPENWMEMLVRT